MTGLRPADVLLGATLAAVAVAGQFPSQWTSRLPAEPSHLVGFMALGAMGTIWVHSRLSRSLPWAATISWLGCVAVGAFDELRQLLLSGRHGDTGDLMVDCLGAGIGVLFAGLLHWFLARRVPHGSAS